MTRESMPISSSWFQGAIITYLIGFTVLALLAYSRQYLQESWRAKKFCLPVMI